MYVDLWPIYTHRYYVRAQYEKKCNKKPSYSRETARCSLSLHNFIKLTLNSMSVSKTVERIELVFWGNGCGCLRLAYLHCAIK